MLTKLQHILCSFALVLTRWFNIFGLTFKIQILFNHLLHAISLSLQFDRSKTIKKHCKENQAQKISDQLVPNIISCNYKLKANHT